MRCFERRKRCNEEKGHWDRVPDMWTAMMCLRIMAYFWKKKVTWNVRERDWEVIFFKESVEGINIVKSVKKKVWNRDRAMWKQGETKRRERVHHRKEYKPFSVGMGLESLHLAGDRKSMRVSHLRYCVRCLAFKNPWWSWEWISVSRWFALHSGSSGFDIQHHADQVWWYILYSSVGGDRRTKCSRSCLVTQ